VVAEWGRTEGSNDRKYVEALGRRFIMLSEEDLAAIRKVVDAALWGFFRVLFYIACFAGLLFVAEEAGWLSRIGELILATFRNAMAIH
jgi:hypothetical protein